MVVKAAPALLDHLRTLLDPASAAELADQELLRRFATTGDGQAFAALMHRHGGMVWRVCRRILSCPHAAEDAFQAAFLILARRASCIHKHHAVAAWLHGVARRVALKARTQAAVRQAHEEHAALREEPDPLQEITWREAQAVLDEELARLSDRLRAPLVLCYLEGATQDQAARRLGWSLSTLKRRLEQAKELLRTRLGRRGLPLSAALSAALLGQGASAALPESTARAVLLVATRQAVQTISPRAAALVEGALKGLATVRASTVMALVLTFGVLVAGAGLAAFQARQDQPPERNSEERAPAAARAARKSIPQKARQMLRDAYGDPLPPGAVARLGTVRLRHEGQARGLAFSPDDKILAAICWSRVILWDAATGKELRRLPVLCDGLDFSPDGKLLAVLERPPSVGGRGDLVSFWDPATGKELRSLTMPQPRFAEGGSGMRFSPDGKTLAINLGAAQIHVIDVATGKLRHVLGGHRASVYGLAFSPNSKIIARGTLGPSVQLWDAAKGSLIRGIDTHKDYFVHAVAFSPDGKVIASGSWDRIILAEVATGKERARFEAKMQSINGLAFTPDGRTLISGSQDARVRFWDVATQRVRLTLESGYGSGRSLALSHSGKMVATGTSASAIRLWDVGTGKQRLTEFQGHDAKVHAVVFTPDGKFLISAGDGQSRVWDAATWKQVRVLPGSALSLSLTADGKRLASVAYDDTIRIREVAKGRDHFTVKVPELRLAALSPDGKTAISVECKWPDRKSTCVSRWDTATGKRLGKIPVPGGLPYGFAVSPDGRTAVMGVGNGTIHVCDLVASKEGLTLRGHNSFVEALAFSSNGRRLASGSYDRTVRLWELATGQEALVLKGHHRAVGAVALSPDGRLLASADGPDHGYNGKEPHSIRVWDVATGKEIARFVGHDSIVNGLAFSPDGKRLVSAQQNSTVLVWNVAGLAR